ncbi:MAG: hypothetical protein KTR30_32650 [Saprospiraceae bacterium]|nr:hypothetical protein [Saprospiraceae bacterium]
MMKNIFLTCLSLLLAFSSVQAQAGKKALKKASQAIAAFNLDQTNKEKLQEAVDFIKTAEEDAETAGTIKTWLKKGEIYGVIATQITNIKTLGIGDPSELPSVERPAYNSFKAFEKAFGMAEKKYEKKDALKGLAMAQGTLSNMGIYSYDEQKYQEAYENFNAVLVAHDLLKSNGGESALDATPGQLDEQKYITGLAALNANKAAEASELFQELYKANYDKPAIYEALYKIEAEKTSVADAYQYLEAGRKKYPDDVSLLFAEINHFLKLNKLDVLITKLESAIEKEPDNMSLYATLGNVFDNLYQKESGEGNDAKAEEYFNKALERYNQALAKDPKYFDAIYSIGALYYNKAAAMTKQLVELEGDYSKDGLKKYEAMKKKVFTQFDEALPFFKKAEKLNPNDTNTLIALKEIFARKDDLATSNEFKTRLEKVQGGEKNDASYFNE